MLLKCFPPFNQGCLYIYRILLTYSELISFEALDSLLWVDFNKKLPYPLARVTSSGQGGYVVWYALIEEVQVLVNLLPFHLRAFESWKKTVNSKLQE